MRRLWSADLRPLLAKLVRGRSRGRMSTSFLVAGLMSSPAARAASPCGRPIAQRRRTLAALYGDLLASEAVTLGSYWVCAKRRWPRSAVIERLEQLAG